MKLTTSQWRAVNTGMPISCAISSAICSFHCCGSVRKPSASTSTLVSAIMVAVISFSLAHGDLKTLLAGGRHCRSNERDVTPGQERVPVNGLEEQLREVVEPRLA